MNDFEEIKKIFSTKIKGLYQPQWGLCLSGGGMRGMAHIGVIKALEENNLYPDLIAGTSAGSMIGAAYALGMKAEEMKDFFWGLKFKDLIKKQKKDIKKIDIIEIFEHIGEVRKNLSVSFDGGILERVAADLFGNKSFSDTLVPFYAVATDLTNVKEVVFESGKLAKACRASASIPGVFTPYIKDDIILVDGFVLNNLPSDVLRRKGAKIVLSVNLKAFGSHGAKSARFSDVVSSTIDIMSNASAIKGIEDSDLVIEPDLSKYSTYTVGEDNMKKMYEIGYEEALKRMNDIAALFMQ
jgi:NTE family protein